MNHEMPRACCAPAAYMWAQQGDEDERTSVQRERRHENGDRAGARYPALSALGAGTAGLTSGDRVVDATMPA